jgi:MFS family permease
MGRRAQSQELLIAARFVQGVGGAMTSAVILGMIVTMFPEAASRRRRSGFATVRGSVSVDYRTYVLLSKTSTSPA